MREQMVEQTVRLLLIGVFVLFLSWAFVEGAFQYMLDNTTVILHLALQHLQLVGVSALLAIIFAVPVGIVVTRPRFKFLEWFAVNFANIGQTVPSLAILALVMSYLGLGFYTAVFALWIASLLPILRNTITGIKQVDQAVLDAGKGMGMTARQILWKLELPNAAYAIFAGIRTSIVINVGTAALAFLIGGGGLGDLIFTGIALHNTGIMLAGALPVTFLALTLDYVLGKLETVMISKGLQRTTDAV
ncbi:osmoprotectant transport system permease protein [Caldalkalibacillus uzonensis]|uniref:Osmoprotectant transport system permease protein n=1 Tax=Caldalkalibacillus uzonensis TaxID=353224 RepID=A0ABU0CLV6_9BACI|nr:ABC transporter permease [Caldalkalibacillus uzonensis]MDQ0337401.1 osmoprotectant transport system permease protein [Caldalkalibacillus uzonensis]